MQNRLSLQCFSTNSLLREYSEREQQYLYWSLIINVKFSRPGYNNVNKTDPISPNQLPVVRAYHFETESQRLTILPNPWESLLVVELSEVSSHPVRPSPRLAAVSPTWPRLTSSPSSVLLVSLSARPSVEQRLSSVVSVAVLPSPSSVSSYSVDSPHVSAAVVSLAGVGK